MIKFNFKKIIRKINPQPAIGGLEVDDFYLRFLLIKEDTIISASIKLEPGIIVEGKLQDKEKFKLALENLRAQITPGRNKTISVVLNIADIHVYSQVFNLPAMNLANFEEAAKLNLQMVSPMDFDKAYSDWQIAGESKADGGQTDVLGVFIQASIMDEFSAALKESNFIIVAAEFSVFSLARLVNWLAQGIDIKKSHLIIRLGSLGITISVLRQGNLYFNHFISWSSVYGGKETEARQISWEDFENLITREIQMVLNFAANHWQDQITSVLLITESLSKEIAQLLNKNFSLETKEIVLSSFDWPANLIPISPPSSLSNLSAGWFPVLGSALRGIMIRSKDNFISLISPGTEEDYNRYQLITFIRIWRNVLLTSLTFFILIFIIAGNFLGKQEKFLNEQVSVLAKFSGIEQLTKLQEEANLFNRKVDLALKAERQKTRWSVFLEKMRVLAGDEITINRIFVQSSEAPVLLQAQTAGEQTIIAFKEKLKQEQFLKEVDLPLGEIESVPGGATSFVITFKVDLQMVNP